MAAVCPALPGNGLHGGSERMKPLLLTLHQESTTGRQRTQPKSTAGGVQVCSPKHRVKHLAHSSCLTLPTTQELTSPKGIQPSPFSIAGALRGRQKSRHNALIIQHRKVGGSSSDGTTETKGSTLLCSTEQKCKTCR